MTTKAIKISEENYRLLVERSAELAKEEGRPVSLDAALGASLRGLSRRKTMLDLVELKDDRELQKAFDWVLKQRMKYKPRELAW